MVVAARRVWPQNYLACRFNHCGGFHLMLALLYGYLRLGQIIQVTQIIQIVVYLSIYLSIYLQYLSIYLE